MEKTVLKTEQAYRGFVGVDKVTLSDTKTYDRVIRKEAVIVIIHDPVSSELLLVKQFRIGPLADQLEPVAGLVDGDENPVNAAVREVFEETGLTLPPSAFKEVASYYSSPGVCTEKLYMYYVSVNMSKIKPTLTVANQTEHEDLELVVLPLAKLEKVGITNAQMLIAVQYCKLQMHAR